MTASAPVPIASVVIPSGRGARLAFALEALAGQTMGGDSFEVIVARDPRAPRPPKPPPGLNVTFLEPNSPGNIAGLRNAGWEAARGRFVVFTDDDCRAAPDWLARLLAAADERSLVQGKTEPDPDEIHLLHGLARSQSIVGPSPFFQTCNLMYPRSLLEELGGFDEAYGALGEDADLAYRALAAGATLTYVDDALVWHGVIPRTLPAAIREARNRDTMPSLVRRHPELRRALFARVFWRRSHALVLLAVGGLAFSRRHRLALALTLPYAQRMFYPVGVTRPKDLLRRLAHLPSKLLLDLVETAVTIRAAIRERTFLL